MAARRLTVLQVLPALQSGGVERGTLEVAAALVRAGHHSLVLSAGGRLVAPLCEQGSEHIDMPLGRKSLLTLRYIPAFRSLLRRQQVDILHVRSRMPAWIAWLAWRGMPEQQRPRLVSTVHGLYSVNAYSRIMTRAERVIAVSETARRYILENYPATDPQRIVTIRRGVERADFPYGYRPPPSWLESWYAGYPYLRGRRVLTLAGRLTRLKGHEDFIDLVAALREQQLDVHGLIVGFLDPGRADYIDGLRRRIEERGLAGHVTLVGQRSDIREVYAVSDVVLSLSGKPESFGRTVLEALCLGVPVVGYGHGGVGEILQDLYPHGSVPVGDTVRLAGTVRSVLTQAAPPVAECSGYDLATMTARTLELYAALAGDG